MPSSGVQTCALDRKSTRLNSSHTIISYAVFCLKKTEPAAPRRSPAATTGTPSPPAARAGVPGACRGPASAAASRAACVRGTRCFFFLMIRRPPRSTLFPYNDALPISAELVRAPVEEVLERQPADLRQREDH